MSNGKHNTLLLQSFGPCLLTNHRLLKTLTFGGGVNEGMELSECS